MVRTRPTRPSGRVLLDPAALLGDATADHRLVRAVADGALHRLRPVHRRVASSRRCGCSTSPPASCSPTRSPTPAPARCAWEPDGARLRLHPLPRGRRVPPPRPPPRARRRPGRRRGRCSAPTTSPTRRRGPASSCRATAAGCSCTHVAGLEPHRPAPARPRDRHVDDGDRGRRGHHLAHLRRTATADRLVGVTTLDADRGRVVAVDPRRRRPPADWTTLVAEPDDHRRVLEWARAPGRRHAARALHPLGRRRAVAPRRHRRGATDAVALPGDGVGDVVGRRRRRATTTSWSCRSPRSPSRPACTAGRPADGIAPLRAPCPARPRCPASRSTQTSYDASDGTAIPMFLVDGADTPDRGRPHHPHRLRRLQHRRDARLLGARHRVVRGRRALRRGRHPRRRRGGRGLAPRRHAGQQAADASTTSSTPPTGWSRPGAPPATTSPSEGDQRRPADGRVHHPATRPRRRGALRRAAARHGPLPPVPHRPAVDPRVRRPRRRRRARLAARLLALPPGRRRHLLPGHAAHHGRGGHAGPPVPRPQVRGARCRRPRRAPRRHRSCCGSSPAPATASGKPVGKQADEAADVLAFLGEVLGFPHGS